MNLIDSLFFEWLIRPPFEALDMEAMILRSAALAGGVSVVAGVGTSLLVYKRLTITGTLVGAAIPITGLTAYGYWRFPAIRELISGK
jgi:hypothetical protein